MLLKVELQPTPAVARGALAFGLVALCGVAALYRDAVGRGAVACGAFALIIQLCYYHYYYYYYYYYSYYHHYILLFITLTIITTVACRALALPLRFQAVVSIVVVAQHVVVLALLGYSSQRGQLAGGCSGWGLVLYNIIAYNIM